MSLRLPESKICTQLFLKEFLGTMSKAEKLLVYRKFHGLAQWKMAKKFGVSQVTWHAWESGKSPVTKRIEGLNFELTPGLVLMVVRRYLGLSVREAAKIMPFSHVVLSRRENDGKNFDLIYEIYQKEFSDELERRFMHDL